MAAELSRLHGAKNRIFCRPKFLSHEELAKYYNAADLHISASQMETLGNTVLESLACGVPVLTPRAQGFMDSITQDFNGVMWEPNDMEDALSKVQLLRDDLTLRERLSGGAKASISKLTCEATVVDLLDWYSKVATKNANYSILYAHFVFFSAVVNWLAMVGFDLFLLGPIKAIFEGQNGKE